MLRLIEFPADDLERARLFWEGLLGTALEARRDHEGSGLQTRTRGVKLGVHQRGSGPGDRWSLPYFEVVDIEAALTRVVELGGEVIHPGERWEYVAIPRAARSVSRSARRRNVATGAGPAAGEG